MDTIGSKLVHVASELRVFCPSDRSRFVSLAGVGLVTGTSLQQLLGFEHKLSVQHQDAAGTNVRDSGEQRFEGEGTAFSCNTIGMDVQYQVDENVGDCDT